MKKYKLKSTGKIYEALSTGYVAINNGKHTDDPKYDVTMFHPKDPWFDTLFEEVFPLQPKFKVGDWLTRMSAWPTPYDGQRTHRIISITEAGCGNRLILEWPANNGGIVYITDLTSDFYLATELEIAQALVIMAKARGFKEGVTRVLTFNIINPGHADPMFKVGEERKLDGDERYIYSKQNDTFVYYGCHIYHAGRWADIKRRPSIRINGYAMKYEEAIRVVRFGCATFLLPQLQALYNGIVTANAYFDSATSKGSNRKVVSVQLDSRITITLKELQNIVEACE